MAFSVTNYHTPSQVSLSGLVSLNMTRTTSSEDAQSMKRLPPLPTAVRAAWKPRHSLPSSVKAATPEEHKGEDWIHDQPAKVKADLDLDKVTFHRGKARAGRPQETKVSVMAVYEGKVIAYIGGTIMRSMAEPGDPYAELRKAKIIETEHQIAASLQSSLIRTVEKGSKELKEIEYNELPSTKLVSLRRRIASLESVLADLREEEAELAAQQAKETP